MKDKFINELDSDEKILWTGTQKNGTVKMWMSFILTFVFLLILGIIVYKVSPENIMFFGLVAAVIMIGVIKVYMPMFKAGAMETYALTDKRLITYGTISKMIKDKTGKGTNVSSEIGYISYYYDELSLNKTKTESVYQIKLEKDSLVLYQYSHVYKKIIADDIESAWKIIKEYVKK